MVQGLGRGGNDSVGLGAWVSTANGQFSQTTIHFLSDNQGNYSGTFKLRVSFSVTGSQMTGNAEAIVSDLTGAVHQDLV